MSENLISNQGIKIMKKNLLKLFLLLIFQNYYAQIDKPYEVGTWFNFCSAAITYTFDDNCSNQLLKVVPMFDEFGYKLTLFTVTNWGPNWTGLQKAAANGHEIASHTVTHTSLSGLSDEKQNTELSNSQAAINSRITNQKCITFAYPYCQTGNYSLVSNYYIAARGCQGYVESSTPSNIYNISSIICGSEGSVKRVSDFNSKAENAARTKGWCVYLLHGIDNDGGYSPLSSDTLRKSLEYLKTNEERFWVSTFANVVKYIKERNSIRVKEIYNSDDTIKVSVTDTLDNNLFNHAVTIRRPLPTNWQNCVVKQNGSEISYKLVQINFSNYVMFNPIPDNGEVLLIKNNVTDLREAALTQKVTTPYLYDNYPNPFNPETIISYNLPKASYVILKVFDVMGKEIAVLVNDYKEAGRHEIKFSSDEYKLSSGIYFYTLQAGNQFYVKKMVLMR